MSRASPSNSRGFGLLEAYVATVVLFLLLPLGMAVVGSFSGGTRIEFPPPSYSLRWYEAALQNRQFMEALRNSALIGLAVSLLSAVAGTTAAIALNHYAFRGRTWIQILLVMPLAVPGIVVGLGQLFSLRYMGLSPGLAATMLSHAVIGIPYVAFMVMASLSGYDTTLEHASANLGAGKWRTFWSITFPHIRPGVIAGSVFAFLISFDQISLSLFVSRGDTLPLRLLQYIQYNNDPSVAAVSTFLLVLALVVLLAFGRTMRASQIRNLG